MLFACYEGDMLVHELHLQLYVFERILDYELLGMDDSSIVVCLEPSL